MILRWARETAGFSAEDAVKKLSLNAARGIVAVDRLLSMEGDDPDREIPTRALLVRMAKQYRRPLLTFYLSQPPRMGDRGQDFRLLPTAGPREGEALLDALIRDVRARQSMVRSVLEDEDEADLLAFVASMKISDGVAPVVAAIQETLGLSSDDLGRCPDRDVAFALLRSRAEEAGVFVLLIGDLGSHHSTIAPETFRGYAIADEVAPFVIINDHDSRAAWAFTLLHELAHIWLGQTGISGPTSGLGVEQFCNDVASQFLLPDEALGALDLDGPSSQEDAITEFAHARNLSRSMVAYRLYRSGVIKSDAWRALTATFRREWFESQERQRARAKDAKGGPNYYVVRGHRTGRALIELVGRMISSGALTTSKASLVLGVKPTQLPSMLRPARGRST